MWNAHAKHREGLRVPSCLDLAQGSTAVKQLLSDHFQELSLFEPRYPLAPAFGHGCSWFSGLQTQTEIYTIGPLVGALGLGLN